MDSYSTCILSLASFTKHIFEVHFVVCTSTSFYWQIVFHIDTPHSLKSTHEFMGIWIAHFLAVNDAAEHSYVQVYVWTYIFISLGYIFRIEVVNHMVTLCLIKKKLPKCFSKMAALFCTPTSSVWELQFLHILTNWSS